MAMSVARGDSGRGRGRRGRRARHAPMSDINVTPMVDVMLVLLIVFMVAAPLLTVGVPIDLPQTKAQNLNTPSKPITLTVTQNGQIFIGDVEVSLEEAIGQVDSLTAENSEQRVFVRGDAGANYGAVMQVMGALSAAGHAQIGLITTPEQAR